MLQVEWDEVDVVQDPDEDIREAPESDGPAEAAEESAPARVVEEGAVTVHRVVTCQKVERQRPVRPATIFRRGPRDSVSVFLEVEAVRPGAKHVKVSLEPRDAADDTGRPVRLKIGPARRYRTYATFRTTGLPAGAYEAVVRDEDERIIALAPVELLE